PRRKAGRTPAPVRAARRRRPDPTPARPRGTRCRGPGWRPAPWSPRRTPASDRTPCGPEVGSRGTSRGPGSTRAAGRPRPPARRRRLSRAEHGSARRVIGADAHRNPTATAHLARSRVQHRGRRTAPRPTRGVPMARRHRSTPDRWVDSQGHVIDEEDRGLVYDVQTLVSRRSALGLFGALGAGALLAGCGGTSDTSSSAGGTTTASGSASAGSSSGPSSGSGDLTVVPDETGG